MATETLIWLGRLLGLSAVDTPSPPRTKKQRVAPPVNTKDEPSLATEELKSSSEGVVVGRPTTGSGARKRVREEEHTGKMAGEDHGNKKFALQVASLLALVGEMITWGACERFPPIYYYDESPLDEDAILEELKGALLPFSRVPGWKK